MIAVDTNVLARYYVDDPSDPEAAQQRPFYAFSAEDCARAMAHLIGLPNVQVEDWPAVQEALRLQREGLDFADALHVVRSKKCDRFYTFDDKKFARWAVKLAVIPEVVVP